jgi:hypothetical protein
MAECKVRAMLVSHPQVVPNDVFGRNRFAMTSLSHNSPFSPVTNMY